MIRGVRERLAGWRGAAARVTPATLLVRGALFVFALAALVVGYPPQLLTRPQLLAPLLVVALAPATLPKTRLPGLVIGIAVVGWLASTTLYGSPVTLPRLVSLACLLYLVHTTAALAAVVPYDTALSPAVLVGWLGRSAAVLVVTGLFAVLAAAGAQAAGGHAYLAVSIGGLLLVAALAGVLAALRR